MFAVFTGHQLHFRVNSHFMKFYEMVLFMSRLHSRPRAD